MSPIHANAARRPFARCARVLLALAFAGVALGDTATITSIGSLTPTAASSASGVSADGSAVIGYSTPTSGMRAIRWSVTGGLQNLGVVPGGLRSLGFAISADGLTATGMSVISGGGHVFQWSVGDGMLDLGTLPGQTVSYGFAMSADGQTIGGGPTSVGDGHALWWTNAGMIDIGTLPGDAGAALYGLSADGLAGTGYSRLGTATQAIYWTRSGGMIGLGYLPGGTLSEGDAISGDGLVVTGFSNGSAGTHAFRWTAATGMRDLGTVPGRSASYGLAISADGSAIAGNDEAGAFIWTADAGMMDLRTYLLAKGVNLTNWTISYCRGISADGTALVGDGRFNGQARGWVVRGLPSLCAPRITTQPASTNTCPFGPATLSISATGSGTLTYQWQLENAPGTWITLGNDPQPLSCGGSVYATGSDAAECQIAIDRCAGLTTYHVRCVVTNACGTTASQPATLTICLGDFNCDGGVDGADVESFFTDWENGNAAADLNVDGGVDGADVQTFFESWEAGC